MQNTSNTLWTFAAVVHGDAALLQGVSKEVIVKMNEIDSRSPGNIARWFTRLLADGTLPLQASAGRAYVLELAPQSTSNSVRTFAQPKLLGQRFFSAMGELGTRSDFDAQGTTNMLRGHGTCNVLVRSLVAALMGQAQQKLPTLAAQNLSNMVWRSARPQVQGRAPAAAAARCAVAKRAEPRPQNLANRFRDLSKSATRGVASFESTSGCALKLMRI